MAGKNRSGGSAARRAKRRRVQGAALSGGALVAGQLAGAPPAQAATITVNTLSDVSAADAFTTLREAIAASNLTPATTDVINFAVAGTILLTQGQLVVTDDVTITGPGSAALAVDGNEIDRVFYVRGPAEAEIDVVISGLTVTHGDAGDNTGNYPDSGGGIAVWEENVTLDHMVVTANTGAEGGGVWVRGGDLTVVDSIISENTAEWSGGIYSHSSELVITRTTVLHNSADPEGANFRPGGGLLVNSPAAENSTSIHASLFDDNLASDGGGIHISGEAPVSISATIIRNNDATTGNGGGLAIRAGAVNGLAPTIVSDSTISGNTAAQTGGGIHFYAEFLAGNASLLIERSTISGNDGAEGGGIQLANDQSLSIVETQTVTIVDSTISGNRALGGTGINARGGGVRIDMDGYGGDMIGVAIEHSTIALNSGDYGGGVHSGSSVGADITLDHTIVATNVVTEEGTDLQGGFDVDWSLIGITSGASPDPSLNANNITGVDPQLAPLADNGGVTPTHMIPETSPAFNRGDPNFAPPPIFDQRGLARVSGPVVPGPRRIDIGAVERQLVPSALPAVVTSSVKYNYRESLTTGPPTLGPFTLGTTPLVPVVGDWDGDGDRTPGFVKGGVFTLSNNADGTGPLVTFTFGQANGFPVVGNWDGDADEEVAIYRLGQWQVRPNTGPGAVAGTTFTFGSGSWPLTVPVAGDWDGNGTDGIGVYQGNGAATGTWTLRQTASNVAADTGPVAYEPTSPGYPVVGDWDGDTFDTLGTKSGATWSLSNTHIGTAPVVDPLYVFDFTVDAPKDLPLVWRYGTP